MQPRLAKIFLTTYIANITWASPNIADDMRRDFALKGSVRTLLVAPLLAFYELACSVTIGHPVAHEAHGTVVAAARVALDGLDADTLRAAALASTLRRLARGEPGLPEGTDGHLAAYLEVHPRQ